MLSILITKGENIMKRIINTITVLTQVICWFRIVGIIGALEINSTMSLSKNIPWLIVFLSISIIAYFVKNAYNRSFKHEN